MLEFVLVAAVSLLAVVDPLGAVPAFLAMTRDDPPAKRRSMCWRAAVAATVTLLFFAVAGRGVLELFGVSLPAFQIAGAIVLAFVALDMLKALRTTQEGPGEVAEGAQKEDVAITPLAFPMLAGPAALSTVTLFMQQAADLWQQAALLGVIVGTGLICYGALLLASPLHRLLGRTGIHVVSRIMGLLLLAIAVQLVWDAVAPGGAEAG